MGIKVRILKTKQIRVTKNLILAQIVGEQKLNDLSILLVPRVIFHIQQSL